MHPAGLDRLAGYTSSSCRNREKRINGESKITYPGHGVSDRTVRCDRQQDTGLDAGSGERKKISALRNFRTAEEYKLIRYDVEGELIFDIVIHRFTLLCGGQLLFVLAENTGFDQLVNELLHGVHGAEEALGRHDDADIALGNGGLTFFSGLQGNKVEADHVAGEVDLTDTIGEDFFFGFHF